MSSGGQPLSDINNGGQLSTYDPTNSANFNPPAAPGAVVPVSPAPVRPTLSAVDTWGKPIPRSWGVVRVPGALIWASDYYLPTSAFTSAVDFKGELNVSAAGLTTDTSVSFVIDLAYSLGFEGIINQARGVKKVRLNGTIIYDAEREYVAAGIGFSLRYAGETTIDPIMARNAETGKFFYPGQTYIIFERFDPKAWGNALPQTIDVEFFVRAVAIGDQSTRDDRSDNVSEIPKLTHIYVFNNHLERLYYIVDVEIDVIHKFNMDTSEYINTIPIIGEAYFALSLGLKSNELFNRLQPTKAVFQKMNVLFAINRNDPNKAFVATLDMETGEYKQYPARTDNADVILSATTVVIDDPVTCKAITTDILRPGQIQVWTITRLQSGALQVSSAYIANPLGDSFLYFDGRTGNGTVATYAQVGPTQKIGLWNLTTYIDCPILNGGLLSTRPVECLGGMLATQQEDGVNKLVRYSTTGTILWKSNLPPGFGNVTHFSAQLNSDMGNGFLGVTVDRYLSPYIVIDIATGAIKFYNILQANNGEDICWDAKLNKFIYTGNPGGPQNTAGYVGPPITSAEISLIDFIRSLYTATGLYVDSDITADADIVDKIIGAYLVQVVGLNATVEAICKLYRLNKIEQGNTVHFYRNKSIADGLNIKLVLDVSELAIEGFDFDGYKAFKTIRGSTDNAPSEVLVSFIDVNASYSTNSVVWRRNSRVASAGPQLSLSIPIVMSAPQALTLAQGVLLEAGTAIISHSFRLSPKHAQLVGPNDIVKITNGPYVDTIQITQHDVNADFSASCAGVSVANENSAEIEAPPPIAADPADVVTTVAATGYIIDGPALTILEDGGAGSYTLYEAIGPASAGAFYGGYFARRKGSEDYQALPTIKSDRKLTVWRASNALTDKRWVLDNDELSLIPVSGIPPSPATFAELQANSRRNAAFYGAPGRWELIQFLAVSGNKLVGAMRGLRGTEVFCGLHEPNDLVILIEGPVVAEKRAIGNNVGTQEEYKAVSLGKSFTTAPVLPLVTIEAVSARPYAPGLLRAVRDGGTIELTWERRDRLGTGWGAVNLVLSEAEEKYKVQVLAADESVLLTTEVTTNSYTYNGDAASFTVQQLGETGYGSLAKRMID